MAIEVPPAAATAISSPTNKIGQGLVAYREKRQELLSAGVHVVEVDLVRQGDWRALMRPHVCPPDAVAPYRVTMRTPPGASLYLFPAPLRERLPDIPVPLRPEYPRITLSLQPLIDLVYANGRYGLTLDYTRLCDPPLEGEDTEWAEDLVRRAGGESA